MDKILVTGGLGTIGAFVCRALLATSRQPVIYDADGNSDLICDIAAACVIERGNICDLPRLLDVISGHRPVAIAHLAGLTGPQVEQQPWSALNANLVGTTTLMEAARLSNIQRVVFPSSRQVYGPVAPSHRHPFYTPVPETHPRQPLNMYGKLKRACEDVADHYARRYGLDVIALRLGSSLGLAKFAQHGKTLSPVIGLIEAAIARRPFRIAYGAEQADDLCYSGEAANGFVSALDSAARPGTCRPYNISSGELISLSQMITVLSDLYPGLDAEAGPGLDYRRLGDGYYFRMDLTQARNELGYAPRFDFRRAVIDYAQTRARLKH